MEKKDHGRGTTVPEPAEALGKQAIQWRRIRVVRVATLTMFLIAIPFVFLYASLGLYFMSGAVLTTMAGCLANLWLLKHRQQPRLAGHIAVGLLFTLLLCSNYVSGGFYQPNFAWFYIVPLGAGVLADIRAGWTWVVVILLVAIAFWLFEQQGIKLENLVPKEGQALQSLFNRLSSIIAIGVLTHSFVAAQRWAESRFEESSRSLSKEIEVRRAAEDKVRLALARERKMRELQSRFVTSASHEFRTPLSVMQNATDLLLRYPEKLTGEQRTQRLERIQSQIRSLTQLLDDLLVAPSSSDLSVLSQADAVDICQTCAEVVDELSSSEGRSHHLKLRANSEPLVLRSVAFLVRRIVYQLVANAIHHTPKGSHVNISITMDNDIAQIRVSDDGPGIPPDERERVFLPFQLGRATEHGAHRGMGLATAVRNAELLGGKIMLLDNQERGATFLIDLPAQAPPSARSPTSHQLG